MTILTCTAANVAEFNARLKAEMPDFHAFARELHRLGMIEGLRGARIAAQGELSTGVQPVVSMQAEKRQLDAEWQAGVRGALR